MPLQKSAESGDLIYFVPWGMARRRSGDEPALR
jgi:hypothetical protein